MRLTDSDMKELEGILQQMIKEKQISKYIVDNNMKYAVIILFNPHFIFLNSAIESFLKKHDLYLLEISSRNQYIEFSNNTYD